MTDRRRLLDNYEDALFALMMDELVEEEGQQLLEENERLKQDPDAAVPEDVDKRCLKTIKRTFARKHHMEVMRLVSAMFRKVAVFAFVMMIMYGTAYAAFPEVRTKTLNLLIEMSDVSARLTSDNNVGSANSGNRAENVSNDGILQGYQLPPVPDGFEILSMGNSPISGWIRYTNNQEKSIYLSIATAENMVRNRDSENVDSIEIIQIHSYDGLLIEKDDRIDITWCDTDRNNFISVSCTGIDRNTAVQFAEGLEFVQ
ncbi:MAG: hypothetical protein HFF62_15575 [Oscillospiraceae bacterium]|nr:hypothetical protein [Oscillospiraceae bacterium]